MIRRTITCDLCKESLTEVDFGKGYPGWAIISGIAAYKPEDGIPLTQENMQFALCPKHKVIVSDFIQTLQDSQEVS